MKVIKFSKKEQIKRLKRYIKQNNKENKQLNWMYFIAGMAVSVAIISLSIGLFIAL